MAKLKLNLLNGFQIVLNTWKIIEKKQDTFVRLQCGLESNRIYNVYFLVKGNNTSILNAISELENQEVLFIDEQFMFENDQYCLIKSSSYNKILIDNIIDHFRNLQNEENTKFIRSNIIINNPIVEDYHWLFHFIEKEWNHD